VNPALRHEVYLALPWLAVAIPVANVTWVFAGAINGAERFGIYNTNQTLGTFLFQLLPLAAAWAIAPNLQTVLAAAVFARLVAGAMLGRSALRVLNIRRLRAPRFDTATALFKFGGWMLVASITGVVADSLDRMMLGAGLGARFVTYYTVPQNLVTRLSLVPNALVRTLFPRLSALRREHADEVAAQSLQFLNALFTPVAIGAIVVLEPFLHMWVGPVLAAHGAPVGRVLIIAVWLVGQAGVTRVLIQAQNNPAATARVGLVELPLFAGLLWLGIARYGLPGAAAAVLTRALFDYLVLLYLSRIHARTILVDMFAHLSFLAAALALASWLPGVLYAIGAGVLLALANAMWSVATTAMLRGHLRSLLFRLYSRKSA
jgi:O-antigen/teichoic acid export membrane protein